jgi:undecaprenyl-diphosphatase
MGIVEAIIIAIVEGITEFLPVSSTGHMIITSSLLKVPDNDFKELFIISIQLGAILSVVVLYWKRFINVRNAGFYLKLLVAFIPAAIAGLLLKHKIEALLKNDTVVAMSLLLGGIILLFVDSLFNKPKVETEEKLPYKKAFIIGVWQCIAMVPGVSRSAATIIGGLQQRLTRKLAAEFSFFLAVPTMFAATAKDLYDFYKKGNTIGKEEVQLLAIGNIVAFIVALMAVKFFITYLQRHGFKIFGWYRIIAGIILLILIYTGYLK